MHPYCELALAAIKYYLERGEIMMVPEDILLELLNTKAGAFVSLHERDSHDLRGCIGTFLPTQENLALEIINNAIAAATEDPRFLPLQESKLDDVEINVDVLGVPEACKVGDLDPKKYGVIVTKGGQRGLLLPDLEGVNTVKDQLKIACSKAGIDYADQYSLQRFTVDRYR